MSAIMKLTPWCIAIGTSKVTRSFAYSTECSYAACATPTAPIAVPGRVAGARPRLRETERAENRLFEQRRQPRALLLVRAEADDRACAEAVRRDRGTDARATPVELFADEHAVERGEARASVLLGNVEVHEAELVRLLDHFGGMPHGLVALVLERADLLRREVARNPPPCLLLLRQGEGNARCRALLERDHRNLHAID